MRVKGKELVMHYSIGADIEIEDEITKHGAADYQGYIERRGSKGYIKIASILNKWAAIRDEKDDEKIPETDFFTLDTADLTELIEEVVKAIRIGQHQDVETKETKNAESPEG